MRQLRGQRRQDLHWWSLKLAGTRKPLNPLPLLRFALSVTTVPASRHIARMPEELTRAILGLTAAAALAMAARRTGSLTGSGAFAATLVGAAAVAAGWGWGTLLAAYFLAASALSRWGVVEKDRRTAGIVAKGGARDAMQVFANGAVFALCALASAHADPSWARLLAAAAAGSLAAATADTWATEIGTLFGGEPRAALTLRPAAPGTSGAVSGIGMAAMIAGALFVALVARALGLVDTLAAVILGGCAGAIADTLLGGALQERWWCDACALGTERPVHDCGRRTRRAGGLAGLDNDAVNAAATLTGAVVTLLLAYTV
jgi:uncharacterized protein (TIGR00297 family)